MRYLPLTSCVALIFPAMVCARSWADEPPMVFHGVCDVSAAVALDEHHLLVADDESNVLRLYDIRRPTEPVRRFDLTDFLRPDPEHPEADIEAAARVGDRVYWISSHGRNKDGKLRSSRYRFFATRITRDSEGWNVEPIGWPCTDLLARLIEQAGPMSAVLRNAARLDDRLSKKHRERLAPKDAGVNIEGMTASADGSRLYIGFRNPLVKDSNGAPSVALVAVLLNPAAVVERSQSPRFAPMMTWNLGGLGVRSIYRVDGGDGYVIVAGPVAGDGTFALYHWSGSKDAPPVLTHRLDALPEDFKPETLLRLPGRDDTLLLSDDGSREIEVASPTQCLPGKLNKNMTCENKHLADQAARTFRGAWLVCGACPEHRSPDRD